MQMWLCLWLRRKRTFARLLIPCLIIRVRLRVRGPVFFVKQVFCGWSPLRSVRNVAFMGESRHLWRTLDILRVVDCSFPLHSDHVQEFGEVQVEMLIQIQIVEVNGTGSIVRPIFHDIFVLVIIIIWAREYIVMLVLWRGNLLNLRVRNVRSRDSCSIG